MRHAQTDRPGIFHGYESDADLSPLGYRQAAVMAPVVASWKPDAIISSGMRRARLTAEPMAAACGLSLRIEPELHERKVGVLVGTSATSEWGIWPDTLRHWLDGDTGHAPEGAESFDAIQARVLPVWERITTEFASRSVVIVAHGIVCRVILLSVAEGYSLKDWPRLGRVANVSYSELQKEEGKWKAIRIGEVHPVVRELEEKGR